jgi:hypothetical protein
MKKLFTLCLVIALFNITLAQAPQKFAYQGVARNNSGAPIINQLISIRASILHATSTGTAQYVETQSVTTNTLGLFTIQIGNGTVQSGTFSAITWANGSKFMKVEFDPAGGSAYTLVGTTEILSVPYALNATTAESAPSAMPKFIANVNLVNISNGTGSGTYSTVYVGSQVPVGTKFAILSLSASSSGGTSIDFRKNASSTSLYSGSVNNYFGSNYTLRAMQLIVPLDVAGTFQYILSNVGGQTITIDLIGYY